MLGKLDKAILGEPNKPPGIRSPGGKAASARRVVIYRGLAMLLVAFGLFIGDPWINRMLAASFVFLILAELATVARAVEETAMQGERLEVAHDKAWPSNREQL